MIRFRAIFDSPILNRELRTLLRSRRSFIWLTLFLIILLIAFTIAWSQVEPINRDVAARTLFFTIVFTQGLLFYFLAPILTSGSLSGEHERRTFELLAVTPLSGYHVALAKCFSALCYVVLLVIASIPVLAITFLLGGVGWVEIVAAAVSILTTVLVTGMVGVVCSAWVRRTYVALMLSLALVGAGFFFCPCAASIISLPIAVMTMRGSGPFGGGMNLFTLGITFFYTGVQLVILLGLLVMARNGYLAGSRTVPVRRKRIIRSRVVLQQRQRRFPYYLIDPLKAPPPIRDGANPVYVRDTRHQPLGRLDFVIRISYVCLFVSVFIGLVLLGRGYFYGGVVDPREFFEAMVGVSHVAVVVILIASPLFASAAFTNEKEHGTFVPMMTTLIRPSEVLWAKLKLILRYSVFLVAALFVPAFGEMFFARGGPAAMLRSLLWLFPFYVLVIAASALLGLFISARSRRNVASMTATYLVVVLCCFGPWPMEWLFEGVRLKLGYGGHPSDLDFLFGLFGWAAHVFGPFLSPFYFLSGRSGWLSARGCYDHPEQALVYVGFWAVVLVLLFVGTVRAMNRAVTSDTTVGRAW